MHVVLYEGSRCQAVIFVCQYDDLCGTSGVGPFRMSVARFVLGLRGHLDKIKARSGIFEQPGFVETNGSTKSKGWMICSRLHQATECLVGSTF